MLVWLRREYAQLLTSGSQLLLLLLGAQLHSRQGWLCCLAAIALMSVIAWLSSLNRLRVIRDTPASKIASAAQGYVEIFGRGEPFCDPPLRSKLSLLPCLWYRYKVEQRDSRNNWQTIESGESSDSFVVRDETGCCVIQMDQAEIVTRRCDRWSRENYRYTEWKLIHHDPIYVVGDFRTQGGTSMEFDARTELNVLLTKWKNDQPALHARFDLDNDGALDQDEWQLVRQAAQREVEKELGELQAQPEVNIISNPPDGKLFLISNLSQKSLRRRYLLWTWLHLLIFFSSLAVMGWIMQNNNF